MAETNQAAPTAAAAVQDEAIVEDASSDDEAQAKIVDKVRDHFRLLAANTETGLLLEVEHGEAHRAAASRYWRAVTRGWGPDRHGRICLVEMFENPDSSCHPDLMERMGAPEAARQAMITFLKVFRM